MNPNKTVTNIEQGTTIQLVCFLAAEFPVQFLTKRYGFKYVLPTVCRNSGAFSFRRASLLTAFAVDDVLLGFGL